MTVEPTRSGDGCTMRLMLADAREVEVEGQRVRYYTAGAGPPVVLLHGLGGAAVVWYRNVRALADSYTVYVPELWGAGRTPVRGRSMPETVARFVAGLLDAVGAASAHLVGGSLGGIVAGFTAIRAPERVRSLTLVGTAGLSHRIAPSQRLLSLPLVGEALLLRPSRSRVSGMLKLLIRRWDADAERLVDELYALRCEPGVPRQMLEALRSGVDVFGVKRSVRLLPALCDVRVPSLLVWGSRDPLFPLSDARHAAEVLHDTSLHVVEGSGHWPYLEFSAEFNHVLLAFLARSEQAAAS